MTMTASTFLTAEWRYLVMLNYVVDPDLLKPLVPRGTELDWFDNRTYLSVVGFQFMRTRVFGVPFPLHTDFEEVNLRFYVRRKVEDGWRRGVVFVRELVPRRAIAFIARTFYGEPYSALPMKHRIDHTASALRVEYAWRRSGKWEWLSANALGEPRNIEPDSEEEFIAEHYWGYTARPLGCNEYRVEHRRWLVWPAVEAALNADVAELYGDRFASTLLRPPSSAFIADGSPITVSGKTLVRAGRTDSVPKKAQRGFH